MSYTDKLSAVRELLEKHNEQIPPNPLAVAEDASEYAKNCLPKEGPGHVDIDQFIANVKSVGGTTEELLKSFKYEEVADCLPEVNGKKMIVLAKAISGIFRDKDTGLEFCPHCGHLLNHLAKLCSSCGKAVDTGEQLGKDRTQPGRWDAGSRDSCRAASRYHNYAGDIADHGGYVSDKYAKRMGYRELVEHYNPKEADSAVTKRLKDIAGVQNFIVFDGDKVNVEETFKLLLELNDGYPQRPQIQVGGVWKKVHPIGYRPDNLADENPIYHGLALRSDGTCDHTQRSWAGIGLRTRQLVYLAVKSGEIQVNVDSVHNLLDMLELPDGEKQLERRCPKACIKYSELADLGTLPALKVSKRPAESTSVGKGPLDDPKKVEWYVGTPNRHHCKL